MDVKAVEDRLIGAQLVGVNTSNADKVELHFEHRGTDDDSGVIVVSLTGIYFNDGGFDGAPS